MTFASTLTVGVGMRYQTPCEALQAAEPGDVISLRGGRWVVSNDCQWSADGVTLRGDGAEIYIDGASKMWRIIGNDNSIENVRINGGGLEFAGRDLSLRGVSIVNATTGLLIDSADGSTVTVEQSSISDVGVAIEVRRAERFVMKGTRVEKASQALFKSFARNLHLIDNQFLTSTAGARNTIVYNCSSAIIEGNTFERSNKADAHPLLQFVHESESGRELRVHSNTFRNAIHSASVFVELLGSNPSRGMLRANTFQGLGTVNADEWFAEANTFEELAVRDEGARISASTSAN